MEEIIIDSECSYYNKDNYPYCCEIWDNECEAQDCYYKQLKRKEKDCRELLKIIDFKDTHRKVLEAEQIKLRQALQEIKEISNNWNLTVTKRREQIAQIISEVEE